MAAEMHKDILDENIAVGWMFASKAIVQLIANPVVGPITNRYVCMYLVFIQRCNANQRHTALNKQLFSW